MGTLLFTVIFIVGILAVALYFWQKPRGNSDRVSLPSPPQPRGLFEEHGATANTLPEGNADETQPSRSLLIDQAKSGDKGVLDEAHAIGAKTLYDELLDLLVAGTDSDANLLLLVSYVARHELAVNHNLAQAVLDSWRQHPDRNSTAKALHVAALADDAELYQGAVETALQYFREGKLAGVTPSELQALFDGEFWVLSQQTRGSGAGFILKRTLANARRELGNTSGIIQ